MYSSYRSSYGATELCTSPGMQEWRLRTVVLEDCIITWNGLEEFLIRFFKNVLKDKLKCLVQKRWD